jgi:FtsP/CotA-like multicopper oxidase with cupredoxin domain
LQVHSCFHLFIIIFHLFIKDQQFSCEFQRPGSNFWINGHSFLGHAIEQSEIIMNSSSLQEWFIRNAAANNHPFHLHNTHFQIVGYHGSSFKDTEIASDALLLKLGMWRDTIPV